MAVETSLPNDSWRLQRGITLGQPWGTDSELGKAVDGLAGKLMGVVPEIRKKPRAVSRLSPLLSHT